MELLSRLRQNVAGSTPSPAERLAYHEGQRRVLAERGRFNVIVCGRRWGKTRLGVDQAAETAFAGERVGWFAPNYKYLQEAWYGLLDACRAQISRSSKTDKRIELAGGGIIEFWSLEDEDAGRSRAYHRVIIDEAAKAPYLEAAWTKAIRPTLSDYRGDAWFLSTPMGRNYFWRLSNLAHDNAEWRTWSMPTSTNPHIDKAEIEAARRDLPEAAFRQEYLAAFVEDAGLVFRKVHNATWQPPGGPEPGRIYRMGTDWAQVNDWTVNIVMDDLRRVVAMDRFNQISWETQRGRLAALASAWNVEDILAEHNSIGGPNIEQLQAEGLPIRGFVTTSESKQEIMVALQLAFEREELKIPDNPVLISELEAFEATRLPSGRWRYEAPAGEHDDTVIALALALEAINSSGLIGLRQGHVQGRGTNGYRRTATRRTT